MKKMPSVTDIKQQLLPGLFQSGAAVNDYAAGNNVEQIKAYTALMEKGTVSQLATLLNTIIADLGVMQPNVVVKTPGWFDRIIGKTLEQLMRYEISLGDFEARLQEARQVAGDVKQTLAALDRLLITHADEVDRLQRYIQAGQEFLAEHPQLGVPEETGLSFERPRERFERRLTNLITLLTSHELSITQMKLAKVQAHDLLDRFEETVNVLIPVWRQHTRALQSAKNFSPELLAKANQAHEALMRSLDQSLKTLQ